MIFPIEDASLGPATTGKPIAFEVLNGGSFQTTAPNVIYWDLQSNYDKHTPTDWNQTFTLNCLKFEMCIRDRLKTGCQWEYLPVKELFSGKVLKYGAVFHHYNKWSKKGEWKSVSYTHLECIYLPRYGGTSGRYYAAALCTGG